MLGVRFKKKSWLIHFLFVVLSTTCLMSIGTSSFANEPDEEEPRSKSTLESKRAFEELMSANTKSQFDALAIHLRNEISEQARARLVTSFLLLVCTEPEIQEMNLSLAEGEVNTQHNLTSRAGRAAWGIEQLLDMQLPSASYVKEEGWNIWSLILNRFKDRLRKKVKERLMLMSASERIEQAKSPKPKICPTEVEVIIDVLADDENTEVRKAALKSNWLTGPTVLRRFEKEKDPSIRELLEQFRLRAFTVMGDWPEPEGW